MSDEPPKRPPSVLTPDEDWPPRPLSSKEAYEHHDHQPAPPEPPPPSDPGSGGKAWPLKVALGLMLVAVAVFAANLLRGDGSGSDPARTNQAAGIDTSADDDAADSDGDDGVDDAADPTATPAGPDTASSAMAAGDDGTADGDADASGTADVADSDADASAADAESPDTPPIRGVMSGGQIALEGSVPSAEVSASLVELMEGVVGSGNVVNALVVDEAAPDAEQMSLIIGDDIVFPTGSATIEPEFLPVLDQIIRFMTLDPNITVVVEGHTDSRGDPILNLALSQQRAEAVVDYFAGNGINRFRIEPRGRGNTEPLGDESTEDGRRQNRRIEFDIEGFRVAMAE